MNFLKKLGQNRTYLDLFLLLCLSIIMVLPVYFAGIPNGNDLPQHYQFGLTFKAAMAEGIVYPGWAADANGGYGDIGIRFYPPFSYYVLIGFERLVGNWYDASVFAFAFWFFISGIGIYIWAKDSFSANASLLAAACYIAAAYHTNQLYNAFTYAEFAAATVLPFCFLFASRICRNGKPIDIILLAMSYALLLTTHIPMGLIGSISLAVFSIASLRKTDKAKTIFRLASAVGIGLIASSFYWMRMAPELDLIRHATEEFRSASYDFHFNFIANFFLVTTDQYNERSLWFVDLMCLMTLCIFLPSFLLIAFRRKTYENASVRGALAVLLAAIFFATPLSVRIYENVGPLEKIQFPWRWLGAITLASAFLLAASFDGLASAFRSRLRPFALFAAGLIVASMVFTGAQVIKQAYFMDRGNFRDGIAYFGYSNSYECWWPVGTNAAAFEERFRAVAPGRLTTINTWASFERTITVSPGEPEPVRIATFYYPHWKATVNGSPVTVERDDYGVIMIPVPAEESFITLKFEEPMRVKIAYIASIVMWILMIGALCLLLIKGREGSTGSV